MVVFDILGITNALELLVLVFYTHIICCNLYRWLIWTYQALKPDVKLG